jgi:hypothetical protein
MGAGPTGCYNSPVRASASQKWRGGPGRKQGGIGSKIRGGTRFTRHRASIAGKKENLALRPHATPTVNAHTANSPGFVSSAVIHLCARARGASEVLTPPTLIASCTSRAAPLTMRISALAAALAAPLVAAQVPNRPPTWIMNQSTMCVARRAGVQESRCGKAGWPRSSATLARATPGGLGAFARLWRIMAHTIRCVVLARRTPMLRGRGTRTHFNYDEAHPQTHPRPARRAQHHAVQRERLHGPLHHRRVVGRGASTAARPRSGRGCSVGPLPARAGLSPALVTPPHRLPARAPASLQDFDWSNGV